MTIVERLDEIDYILFHTRNAQGYHLYPISGDIAITSAEEIDSNVYQNIKTSRIYAIVNFEAVEVNHLEVNPSLAPYKPTTRYDAQFATIYDLLHNN